MREQQPWNQRQCRVRKGDDDRWSGQDMDQALNHVPGWSRDNDAITRTFRFANYYETIAFVNTLAWVAHGQDHHPDLQVGYRTCCVRFSTHSVGGLSENDVICAARINALVDD